MLERRAGSLTLPYRVVVRAKLVLLAADGHTNREIAARVDMSSDRVADWRRRFAAEGIEGLEDPGSTSLSSCAPRVVVDQAADCLVD